jgi:hypothetical protein
MAAFSQRDQRGRQMRAHASSTPSKTGSHARSGKSGKPPRRAPSSRRWSQRVTRESNALDLDPGVFRLRSAKAVALSLKRSAERSHRRKGTPYQSAMSMLTFYLNRAGRGLGAERRRTLMRAKAELRRLFQRD